MSNFEILVLLLVVGMLLIPIGLVLTGIKPKKRKIEGVTLDETQKTEYEQGQKLEQEKEQEQVQWRAQKNEKMENHEHERAPKQEQKKPEVEKIIDAYMKLHESSRDKGISALFKSGIDTLADETQAELVINEIEVRISTSPLGRYNKSIRRVGILKFFQNTSTDELNKKGIEHTIEEIENKFKY